MPLLVDASGHMLAPLHFGDVELHFMLDTAALMSFADPVVIEHVHSSHVSNPYLIPTTDPRDYVSRTNGPAGARFEKNPAAPLLERSAVSLFRFSLGEIFIHKHRSVILHDFGHFRAAGLPVYGIVWLDVLSARPVELNFCANEMRIAESFTSPAHFPEVFDLGRTRDGFREVSLRIHQHEVTFLLDSGASHSYLSAATVQRVFGNRSPDRLVSLRRADAYGVRESAPMRVFVAQSVQIGETSVQNVEFMEGEYDVLGMNYLGQFRWHLDFQHDVGQLATCH